ncbi:MAG TPA: universal stress protein [Polyangiaceae bacterium]|jgi:nucleotide-binding universal stress UspA family protein
MNPIETILVATDFSEQSRAAVDWAVDLAKPLGAKVVVVHAYALPIVGILDASLMVDATTATRMSTEAQAALDAEVKRASGRGAGGGVAIEGSLREGDAREVLPQAATDTKAGLLVVGSHGRRGLQRALLGSVAENVARSSPVPVVVVHPKR